MRTIDQVVARGRTRLGRRLALAVLATALMASGVEAKKTVFTALLNGGQETPPVPSPAHGNAFLVYDTATAMLCHSISFSGLLAAEILAHIHGPAAPGAPGGVVFPLPLGNPKNGCVGPLTPADQTNLKKGLLYVNIHSAAFPGGEIRGQILNVKGAKY